mgnify:CR=1 FL=1
MKPLHKTPFFDLKQNYLIYFESCVVLSLFTFIGLFKLNLPAQPPESDFKIPPQEILSLEYIPSSIYALDIPKPPPKVTIPITPTPDTILEDDLHALDMEFTELDQPLSLSSEGRLLADAKTDQGSSNNAFSGNMPFLIGGITELQKRIEYPTKALKDKVEGRVVIQFIVDRNGKVRNPEIIKGVRRDLNKEALRAVSNSRFRPGQVDGKTVPVEQVLHILFKIEYSS